MCTGIGEHKQGDLTQTREPERYFCRSDILPWAEKMYKGLARGQGKGGKEKQEISMSGDPESREHPV